MAHIFIWMVVWYVRWQENRLLIVQATELGQTTTQLCKIWLQEEKIKEVTELKYLGIVLCKHGSRQ